MFAVNRLRKSLLSFHQKRGDKKSPRTVRGGQKSGGVPSNSGLALHSGWPKPALSLSNGRYFPEETMTFAVFKILFLSL